MKSKSILLLAFLLFSVNMGFAQLLLVRDIVTLETLPGVIITDGTASVTTDYIGKAEIGSFKNKTRITLLLVGFESLTTSYKDLESKGWIVGLVEDGFFMNEVVVSASKFEERKEDIAQQVQVIDKRDMKFMSQQTTADVLQQSGNVHVQKSQQGGGSPIIRGFEANKVLIVLDGVRMNNAIYRGGHLQDVISMDNSIMDRVEILYGPGSVVYGSDALGGVMHFYTRNPEVSGSDKLLVKGNSFVRYSSSNNEMTGHIDFNLGSKRLSSLTSFTYSSFDDLRQGNVRSPYQLGIWNRPEYVEQIGGKDSVVINKNPNIQIGSGYSQYDILQKVLFKQNAHITHLVNFQYSTSSDVPRYDRLTQYKNGKLRFAEWYYGPQQRLLASYRLSINKTTKWFNSGNVILSFQDVQQSRNSRSLNATALQSQVEDVKVMALNADFEKVVGNHEIRYGTELTFNDVTSTAQSKNIFTNESQQSVTRYPDGGSTMQSAALYITHSWEVNDWLLITDGIRGSNVQLKSQFTDTTYFPFPFREIVQNNNALNGNLGIILKPGHDWRISLLGSTGFRAPNVDDLTKVFESSTATRDANTGELIELGNLIIPNPNLKPEYTYNADFGVSKTIVKQLTITGTAFYTKYKDAITKGYSTFRGDSIVIYSGDSSLVSTSINAANAYIYGFSGQLAARLTRAFDLSSSINYTYARIKDGNAPEVPLDHIPPVFGKTSFNVQIKKFRAEFWAMYSGWKRLEDYRLGAEDNESNATEHGMPAWYTLNLRASYQLNNYISVQMALDNILDQNYRMFASNISASGRNLVGTLRARF